jgi:hypothetical protein
LETVDTERRSSPRIPDDIPALFARGIGDPDIRAATVLDLSDGGVRVTTATPLQVGTRIYVGFFLQGFGGVPLVAKMRVAWTMPEGGVHMIGLAFLPDGGAQRDSVERMREHLAARRREMVAAG